MAIGLDDLRKKDSENKKRKLRPWQRQHDKADIGPNLKSKKAALKAKKKAKQYEKEAPKEVRVDTKTLLKQNQSLNEKSEPTQQKAPGLVSLFRYFLGDR